MANLPTNIFTTEIFRGLILGGPLVLGDLNPPRTGELDRRLQVLTAGLRWERLQPIHTRGVRAISTKGPGSRDSGTDWGEIHHLENQKQLGTKPQLS